MKKKIVLLVVCFIMLICIFVQNIKSKPKVDDLLSTGGQIYEQEEMKSTGIPRAEAFRLVSYLFDSDTKRASQGKTLTFQDVGVEDWYYEYIVSIYQAGFTDQADVVGEKSYMRPKDELNTYEGKLLFQRIASLLGMECSDIYQSAGIDLYTRAANESITRTQFLTLYEAVLDLMPDEAETGKEELYILSVDNEGTIQTQNGDFYGAELFYLANSIDTTRQTQVDMSITDVVSENISDYVDCRLEVVVNEKRIVYVRKVIDQPTTFHNVFLIHGEQNRLTAYVEGVTKTFELQAMLPNAIDGMVGNITCQNKQVTAISIKPDRVTDKVILANNEYIELEKYGKVEYDEHFHIYKIYDDLRMEETNAILVGYSNTQFVLTDNKISAALITEPITATNIRVMIKTNKYKSLFHESVTLTCKKDFSIIYGDESKQYKAKKEVTIDADSKLLKHGRLVVKANDGETPITLLSIKRAQGNPAYRGSIEISKTEEGLSVINELPLEEYLYAVLPSEMPVSYGNEALKTQAVCARSYAYNQLISNSYRQYGAHIDDSVNYQVYNNYAETKETIKAVKETYGQVIEYDGSVITAYYFSTSCGHTSSIEDVWPGSLEGAYLIGSYQSALKNVEENNDQDSNIDKETVEVMASSDGFEDFSDERVFRDFLTKPNSDTLEKEFAWYRWKTKLSYKTITENIDQKIAKRYEANPSLILTEIVADGVKDYVPRPITTVGEVTGISVMERKRSGIVTALLIQGTKANVLVKTEYNIRALLAPGEKEEITRQDESVVTGLGILPSAFVMFDEDEKGIKITGGGYGHGVGMSQNGVKALADLGYHYEAILEYYYKGTVLNNIYS